LLTEILAVLCFWLIILALVQAHEKKAPPRPERREPAGLELPRFRFPD
jgi:hypothetical protein